MRKVIYSIEGNIGSGKSTLLKALMNSMTQVTTIPEPVDSWQCVAGYNLLDKYYEDPVRWGYTFQINCILSRMTQLSKSIETMRRDKVYISERSVQSDKFIFAKLMHKLKKINDMEYHLYLNMFDALQSLFNKHAFSSETTNRLHFITPQKQFEIERCQKQNIERKPGPILYRHIYLKTSAEKCYERIKKRNRKQQRNMEYNYIKELDDLHDQWLIDGQREKQLNLVLDGQREFETDQVYLNQLIAQIKSYIIENSEVNNGFQISRTVPSQQKQQKKVFRESFFK